MSAPLPKAACRGETLTTAAVKTDRGWSDAELAYLADNLARGYSYSQIAGGLRRSKGSIASAIRRMREREDETRFAPAMPRSRAARSHKLKQVDLVAELMAEGFKFADIAQELDITLNAVKCAFKKIKKRLGAQAV